MRDVYVVAAVRTPLGRAGGVLAGVRPDDLAARVIGDLAARAGFSTPPAGAPSTGAQPTGAPSTGAPSTGARSTVDAPRAAPSTPTPIDDVFWGAANQAGEDNRNVARMAVLLAGLPTSIPGVTVNRLCASGLEAIVSAARAIASGELDCCVAGGSESMSRAPYVRARDATDEPNAWFDTRLGWRLTNPSFGRPLSLGETAEEVARRYRVSRADQDAFALDSHVRAAAARDAGVFDDELLPVSTPDGRPIGPAADGVIRHDEGIRDDTSPEKLAALRPAFVEGGTVTAGNSSQISDGAAGVLLMSADAMAAAGLEPLARYVGSAAVGVEPDVMGIGPIDATHRVLDRAGWALDSIDLVELNEAFASQSLAVIRTLGLAPDRVNVSGGAIALGHPLGCSGARLVVTLTHGMRRLRARRGLASLCVGVGQGVSALFEAP